MAIAIVTVAENAYWHSLSFVIREIALSPYLVRGWLLPGFNSVVVIVKDHPLST